MSQEAFFKQHRKKGLAGGLALLAFGGSKRDKLLVFGAVALALVATTVAGVTGKLDFTGKPRPVVTADGEIIESEAPAGHEEEVLPPEEVFKQAERAAIEAAASRKIYGGVPGKARSDRNEAVKYVSRDKNLIGDAKAQRNLETASEGEDYEGASLGRGNGLRGMQGAGSLGMAAAGSGLSGGGSGATYSSPDSKEATLRNMRGKIGKEPQFGSGPRESAARFAKGYKGGKSSGVLNRNLNARVLRGKKAADPKKGKMGKAMWHLVSASAQTLTSRCTNCAKESALIWNRAYATGEATSGLGLIQLAGDTGAEVDAEKMNKTVAAVTGNLGGLGQQSADCAQTSSEKGKELTRLSNGMAQIKWADGPLGKTPSKCCKVKDYNSKVNEYKAMCGEYNKVQAEINSACGNPAEQGKSDCGIYKEQDTCGDLECFLLGIVMAIVVVIAVILIATGVGGPLGALLLVGVALTAGAYGAQDFGLFGGG